jgi:hypothetical protein
MLKTWHRAAGVLTEIARHAVWQSGAQRVPAAEATLAAYAEP